MKDWQDQTTEKLNPFTGFKFGFGIYEKEVNRWADLQAPKFLCSDWVRNFEIRFYISSLHGFVCL